jgi:hypothetical protein
MHRVPGTGRLSDLVRLAQQGSATAGSGRGPVGDQPDSSCDADSDGPSGSRAGGNGVVAIQCPDAWAAACRASLGHTASHGPLRSSPQPVAIGGRRGGRRQSENAARRVAGGEAPPGSALAPRRVERHRLHPCWSNQLFTLSTIGLNWWLATGSRHRDIGHPRPCMIMQRPHGLYMQMFAGRVADQPCISVPPRGSKWRGCAATPTDLRKRKKGHFTIQQNPIRGTNGLVKPVFY